MITTKRALVVRIEQKHIDEGYRRCHDLKLDSCYNDPIALALNEATDEECSVGYANIRIGRGEMIPMDEQVLYFKKCFDKAWILNEALPFPIEFTIDA